MTGIVWRIVTHRFAASAFPARARLFGGRWNRKGEPVVYTAQSRSLAFLEMMVQDEPLRANYVLIPAEIPGDIARLKIDSKQLPKHWRTLEARETLQEIGNQWLRSAKYCVLEVPSAVIPAELNLLLNPAHRLNASFNDRGTCVTSLR
ncbi:RES domain-containing protein [Nitrosospira sp. Nsp18]|uniref:RES family NAD+ phosphorylase n=1 Tax=Nitrosospira sp. Nsp18 TaxID=1855334 RepID=UPI00088CA5DB|nr:RES family NAD+ phosphorylase [Nitrosospira sp. Nsp18]SDA23748.1 RES domain-containing protein [Nitrosospira sp. Nsp18]